MTDAELDAIVSELEEAGLVEEYLNEYVDTAYRLTRQGRAVGRRLAMTQGEDERDALLEDSSDLTREEARPSRDGPRCGVAS